MTVRCSPYYCRKPRLWLLWLEQLGTDLLLREELALATVDGRRCCFCTQNTVDSREPGTEWPSQLIQMNLIKAPGAQALTDQ